MNDKEFNIQRKRLLLLINKWITPLGLRWWKVNFIYSRDGLSTEVQKADGRYCQARTLVDWEYLYATITFDMQQIAELTNEVLEEVFVHECCHILVHEMRQWADDDIPYGKRCEGMKHEERVVTQLAKAFIWTMEAGLREGKPKVRKVLYPKGKPSRSRKEILAAVKSS